MEGGKKMGRDECVALKTHGKARNPFHALPWASLMAWNKLLALSELPMSKTQMARPQRGL